MQSRLAIVQLRDTRGWTERQIGEHLHVPRATVHYWLAKHDAPEDEEEEDKNPRGRPRVTTTAQDEALAQASRAHPFETAVDLRNRLAPDISVHTVRKRLKEQGQRCRVPARKPFLRAEHVRKRLEFAIR